MKTIGGFLRVGLASVLALAVLAAQPASAQTPPPGPKNESVGVQGTIPTDPPRRAPSVVSPGNGSQTGNGTATVTGSCENGLLVKVYSNGIFAGATMCDRGTYSLPIALFNGQNELEARQYDALDQESPGSNRIGLVFNDAQFQEFGAHVSVTSQFARRGAEPSQELTWPVVISGGVGPYAMTVDWGDGTPPQLYSAAGPGEIIIKHTYKTAATYDVFIRVVDKNRTEGFLRVVAVSSGNTSGREVAKEKDTPSKLPVDRMVIVVGVALLAVLLPTSFWLGRRYELAYLRTQIERDTQA